MMRQRLSPRRAASLAAVGLLLALIACNMPGCGQQPGPTPPERTPIPPTTDVSQLPPTNPQIVTQRPTPGEELPLDGSIDLYFDQPMNQETVERALRIEPAVEADIVWVDDSTVRVTPRSGQLKRATAYKVSVDEQAQSERGLSMERLYSVEVQTVGFLEV